VRSRNIFVWYSSRRNSQIHSICGWSFCGCPSSCHSHRPQRFHPPRDHPLSLCILLHFSHLWYPGDCAQDDPRRRQVVRLRTVHKGDCSDNVQYTHYLPDEWREQPHSNTVHTHFKELFPIKVIASATELASIMLMPFHPLVFAISMCAGICRLFPQVYRQRR